MTLLADLRPVIQQRRSAGASLIACALADLGGSSLIAARIAGGLFVKSGT